VVDAQHDIMGRHPALPLLNLASRWSASNVSSSASPSSPLPLPALQPPFVDALLTARVVNHEPVVLVAEVWAFERGSSAVYTGSGGPAAAQCGFPLSATHLFLCDGSGDSRTSQGGIRSVDAVTASNPHSSIVAAAGLDLFLSRVEWMLSGVPGLALIADYAAIALLPPRGHTLMLNSTGIVAVVAPGTLFPGYDYSARATITSARASLLVDLVTGASATARRLNTHKRGLQAGITDSGLRIWTNGAGVT
jgi:hypothetical protein